MLSREKQREKREEQREEEKKQAEIHNAIALEKANRRKDIEKLENQFEKEKEGRLRDKRSLERMRSERKKEKDEQHILDLLEQHWRAKEIDRAQEAALSESRRASNDRRRWYP